MGKHESTKGRFNYFTTVNIDTERSFWIRLILVCQKKQYVDFARAKSEAPINRFII